MTEVLRMHDNGAVVDAEGKLLVRFVYADERLRAFLFSCMARRAALELLPEWVGEQIEALQGRVDELTRMVLSQNAQMEPVMAELAKLRMRLRLRARSRQERGG